MRNKTIAIITSFVFISVTICAQQGVQSFSGARSLSLANIKSTLNGAEAIIHNFSQIDPSDAKFSAVVGSERRFGLGELSTSFGGIHLSTPGWGHFALGVSSYGFKDYKESNINLSYARKLDQKLSISININYNNIAIQEYGSDSNFGFGIGLSGAITENLNFSFQAMNIEKISLAQNTEARGFLRFGLRNSFSDKLQLHVEIEKYIDDAFNLKAGFEYEIDKKVTLRIGANTHPGLMGFGFGYQVNKLLSLEMGAQYDSLFGVTPGFTASYQR